MNGCVSKQLDNTIEKLYGIVDNLVPEVTEILKNVLGPNSELKKNIEKEFHQNKDLIRKAKEDCRKNPIPPTTTTATEIPTTTTEATIISTDSSKSRY